MTATVDSYEEHTENAVPAARPAIMPAHGRWWYYPLYAALAGAAVFSAGSGSALTLTIVVGLSASVMAALEFKRSKAQEITLDDARVGPLGVLIALLALGYVLCFGIAIALGVAGMPSWSLFPAIGAALVVGLGMRAYDRRVRPIPR